MHWHTAFTAVVLVAGQALEASCHAFPHVVSEASELLASHRRHAGAQDQIRRRLASITGDLDRRQAPSATSSGLASTNTPVAEGTSAINATAWDLSTADACMKALTPLNGVASNPSGMAVCYNLPFFDNSTGVFQADMRLYRISAPIGDWSGIQSKDVTIGLSYIGATVSATTSAKRDETAIGYVERVSKISHEKRQNTGAPEMLQALMFVGQINRSLMSTKLDSTALQGLLIPNIVLSGVNPAGQAVSATLSSKEASFLNGVFADQGTPLTAAAAAAASAAAAKTAFVLPGTTLGIFPLGLIITSIWAALFIGVVGYGTMGRYQFRDHYRRRTRRGMAGKTI